MAINNGNGSVTVQKGDNLWRIARDYGNGRSYQQIAADNGIKNPNLIYPNQVIWVNGSGGGGSSPSSSAAANSNCVTNIKFGPIASEENTLFITWDWGKTSNTDKFLIEWSYSVGTDTWFKGTTDENSIAENSDSDTIHLAMQSTYGIPSGATKVRVRVKPVSKYKNEEKKTYHWTADWCAYQTWTDETPLETPAKPSIDLQKYEVTGKLEEITIRDATHIDFELFKDDGETAVASSTVPITVTKTVSYKFTVEAGGRYRVRCRASKGPNATDSKSDWSPFSDEKTSMPPTPEAIQTIRAESKTSVYLKWNPVNTAKTYVVEYTTKKEYFDISDQTTTTPATEDTERLITGLESGYEYFFRLRAINENNIESSWSEIKSITIGKDPAAPTTWSSTTTAKVGEELTLYWIHNTADASSQIMAELELVIDNVRIPAITIKNSEDEEKKDKTSFVKMDTTNGTLTWTEDDGVHTVGLGVTFVEGVKIQWRVRTAGVTKNYGDWSVQRTIDIYAPPTLTLKITDIEGNSISTIKSFPFYIYGVPGPRTQTPISYHLSVIANEAYETVDNMGNETTVSKGDSLYSKYFDTDGSLLVEMMPSNIDLQTGIAYTVKCVVAMNSGLTAEVEIPIGVSWVEVSYTPDAEIAYDSDRYVTHIRPFCMAHTVGKYVVNYDFHDGYSLTDELVDETSIDNVYTTTGETVYIGIDERGIEVYYCIKYADDEGNPIDPAYYSVNYSGGAYTVTDIMTNHKSLKPVYTTTGERVYIAKKQDGFEMYHATKETSGLVDDVTLSVYRREFDGSFTELATGLANTDNTFITDPHPSLDFARYRVVSVTNSTGSVSYYDVPAYEIGEKAIIIQWDENWTMFDMNDEDMPVAPPWSGSLLYLPYNVDVSESNSPDAVGVKYIGRKHPVAYYGTHIGETASWNTEVPKDDKETIYALRRLRNWMGVVYVREPSGVGYWASITVSFSQKHCELTVPVSMNITRVEGGM